MRTFTTITSFLIVALLAMPVAAQRIDSRRPGPSLDDSLGFDVGDDVLHYPTDHTVVGEPGPSDVARATAAPRFFFWSLSDVADAGFDLGDHEGDDGPHIVIRVTDLLDAMDAVDNFDFGNIGDSADNADAFFIWQAPSYEAASVEVAWPLGHIQDLLFDLGEDEPSHGDVPADRRYLIMPTTDVNDPNGFDLGRGNGPLYTSRPGGFGDYDLGENGRPVTFDLGIGGDPHAVGHVARSAIDDRPQFDADGSGGDTGNGGTRSPFLDPQGEVDLNTDGSIDAADLSELILNWGTCADPGSACRGDLNLDGFVDAADLVIMLFNWG